MAIGTDDLIEKFGTPTDLSNTTSAVNDNSFSDGTNDLNSWTNSDDAPEAAFVLSWQYPSGTINANPYINLYCVLVDIDGTNDTPTPVSDHKHIYLGTFNADTNQTATNDQANALRAVLPNMEASQVYHFYIENQTDVQISASWKLTVMPLTVGPSA